MKITLEGGQSAQTQLSQLSQSLTHLQPLMRSIGDMVKAEIQLNFIGQHDPQGAPWRPLSPRTIAARRVRRRKSSSELILRDTGTLMNSITRNVYPSMVEIGTPLQYGRNHQYGLGVPVREFLGTNPRILSEIERITGSYLLKMLG